MHVYERRDFEVDTENMEVDPKNNKRKKEEKGIEAKGSQKKKVKQNTVQIENLSEEDDPREINVRYENIESRQSSLSSQSKHQVDCSKKVESIKIRLPIDLKKELNQSQTIQELTLKGSKETKETETVTVLNMAEHSDPWMNESRKSLTPILSQGQPSDEISKRGCTDSAAQFIREPQTNPPTDTNKPSSKEENNIYAKGIHTDLTRMHPIRIQNEINQTLARQVQISKSLRIVCKNDAEKKKMRQHTTICDYEVAYSDPYARKEETENQKKGIIFGVDLEIDDTDICEASAAKTARRVIKKIGGKDIVTAQVILCYDHELPTHVFIGWKRYRVDMYIPDPLRCYRCQRYGHKAAKCNGKERCSVCSGPHSVKYCPQRIENENGKDSKETKCANCQGNHPTSYRGCSKYKEAKEVTKIQFTAQSRMTYAQAISKARESKENKTNREGKDNKENMETKGSKNREVETHTDRITESTEMHTPSSEHVSDKSKNHPSSIITQRDRPKSCENLKTNSELKQTGVTTVPSLDQHRTMPDISKRLIDTHEPNENSPKECVEERKLMNFIKAVTTVLKSEISKSNMIEILTEMIVKLIEEINGKKDGETDSKMREIKNQHGVE